MTPGRLFRRGFNQIPAGKRPLEEVVERQAALRSRDIPGVAQDESGDNQMLPAREAPVPVKTGGFLTR